MLKFVLLKYIICIINEVTVLLEYIHGDRSIRVIHLYTFS